MADGYVGKTPPKPGSGEVSGKQLEPRTYGQKDCTEPIIVGQPGYRFDWVPKVHNEDINFDVDLEAILKPECIPWYYYNMGVGNLWAIENIQANLNIFALGEVISNGGAHVLSSKKNLPFDMPHPNKKGWRLRHVCIEGPEIAVYCRGKVPSDGIINLPKFWDGLINPEDMTINITPIGHWQELFVKEIRWGKQVVIQNNAGSAINANYHIIARRLDDDLIVEYEGENYTDYPDGNEGYAFNYEHNYVENIIKETIREELRKK